MKRVFITLAVILVGLNLSAQKPAGDPKGGISPQLLQELSSSYAGNPTDKALRNALNNAPINVLAASAEQAAMIDTHFSDEVKTKGRTALPWMVMKQVLPWGVAVNWISRCLSLANVPVECRSSSNRVYVDGWSLL